MTTKTIITYDARRAGSGKTTSLNNGIIRRASDLVAKSEKVLLVVPSIDIQQEYLNIFPAALLPIVRCINSNDTSSSVSSQVLDALLQKQLVLITHAAFLRIDFIKSKSLLASFNLVIDEAIDPQAHYKITHEKLGDDKLSIDFKQLICFPDLEATNHTIEDIQKKDAFVRCEFGNIGIDSSFVNTQLLDQLRNPNFSYYIYRRTYEHLCDATAKQVLIMSHLKQEIFGFFKTVHIAAADFKNTIMAYYLRATGQFKLKELKGCDFKEHDNCQIRWHYAYAQREDGIEHINWSKNLRNTHPEILSQFYKEVQKRIGDKEHIVLKNKDSNTELLNAGEQIKFNSHGLNAHNKKTAIIIESAIKTSLDQRRFLMEVFGIHNTQITRVFTAYTYYQAIMRLAVRNKDFSDSIDVYIVDAVTAMDLVKYYFANNSYDDGIEVKYTPAEKKKTGPAKSGKAKSSTERARECRARKAALKQTMAAAQ